MFGAVSGHLANLGGTTELHHLWGRYHVYAVYFIITLVRRIDRVNVYEFLGMHLVSSCTLFWLILRNIVSAITSFL